MGHLNINSVRNNIDSVRHIIGNNIDSVRHIIGNKIDSVRHIIGNNIDIFLISETKLNATFPESQLFLIDDNGGGLLLYVRFHIPSRLINAEICSDIEACVMEINLTKRSCYFIAPIALLINNHMKIISMQLNVFQKRYENFIILGDFNSEINEDDMKEFLRHLQFQKLNKSADLL